MGRWSPLTRSDRYGTRLDAQAVLADLLVCWRRRAGGCGGPAIRSRWGVVPLMDMLTETALRTGCLNVFTPAGIQNHLEAQVLFERLLLLIYAYGTGAGVRAVAAGDHPHTEDDLRYVRRRYLTGEACREAARIIANVTFAARQTALWGEGTTAVASDSTHFSAFDQNIFTERHSRYRRAKRGVLIYWTVDVAGSMAVHSQLISCSASEVHEGAMRHGTDMEIEQNFVDSHGATFVGFGITRLLDFDLIARFKQINKMKLYLPGAGARADQADQVGHHRAQLRPDDEVRHRDSAAYRPDVPQASRHDRRAAVRPARASVLPGRSPWSARPGRRRRSRATPARPGASLSQGSENAHCQDERTPQGPTAGWSCGTPAAPWCEAWEPRIAGRDRRGG